MSLLEVKNLSIRFRTPEGIVHAVDKINFKINKGETLAIVGESGSGKTQTAYSILRLLSKNADLSGEILFKGKNLLFLSESEMNKIRFNKISIIFQDPMTSLNPYLTISEQLTEVLILHKGLSKKHALIECIRMLDAVKIPDAKNRIHSYPHENSGGMQQRMLIAMSLLCHPEVLIADEPTTALDVTVQAKILKLIKDLQKEMGTALILITHNLGVVAGNCQKTLVMYAGQIMEYGETIDLFSEPSHPYTRGLLNSIPRIDYDTDELYTIHGSPPNMLEKKNNCVFYPRCKSSKEICINEKPLLKKNMKNSLLRACHINENEINE